MKSSFLQPFEHVVARLLCAELRGKNPGIEVKDIVFTISCVTQPAEFDKCADLRERYFGLPSPKSATVPVPQLANPDFLVQVEAFATVQWHSAGRARQLPIADRRPALYGNFCREDPLLQLAAQIEGPRPEWFGAVLPVHVIRLH